jgi:hypothetical protein
MKEQHSRIDSEKRLTHFNGYIRFPDQSRREELRTKYKKGWEVRLPMKGRNELLEVRQHLKDLGFSPGKPFRKSPGWVQPVYGKTAVETFMSWTAGASPRERRLGRK